MQFAPEQPSMRAITRWARRFGGVVTSQPGTATTAPRRGAGEFNYYGVAVKAYARIPAAPASN